MDMTFHEFETKARLYVVGALNSEDLADFRDARQEFGAEGERFLQECHELATLFALSLRPRAPRPETKERLFSAIRGSLGQG